MKTLLFFLLSLPLVAGEHLPLKTTFKGQSTFQKLVAQANKENWRALPIGERTARVGLALRGIPYKGFTLEIHNSIESPSVNFQGLDCWTFFETSLAFARMLREKKKNFTPHDLLRHIEQTRYFKGRCNGNYLDRIHYLVDWYSDNQRRGNISDLTKKFPTSPIPSKTGEMSKLWKHYRYLKHNPNLRHGMAAHEKRLNKGRYVMVPQNKVRAIESQLRNGDIIGIARNDGGSYCSHVGLIVKDKSGRARFLHASSTHKKVILDTPITDYLLRHKKHAGIIIARPR